jgi:NhaP-type Na+/H+ or K+/H+ antiporter
MPHQIRIALLILVFTVISGLGDAQAFVGASRMWNGGEVVWRELIRSAIGFAIGAVGFWFAVRYMREAGVVATEVQTLMWFGVTIAGVALLSRTFIRWHPADQVVAIGVLVGIGWLMYRVGD